MLIQVEKEVRSLGVQWAKIAVTISLPLKYNIPWDRIARKMRNTNFEPVNLEGKSIMHAVVTAVDKILSERGSIPDKGYSLE